MQIYNLAVLVANYFDLGEVKFKPVQVEGGFLHSTYKLLTSKGSYLLKILNPGLVKEQGKLDRFRKSQEISVELKNCINSVPALRINDNPLFSNENFVCMVFPFINAEVIDQSDITTEYCKKMAGSLATIHDVNINIVDPPKDKVAFKSIEYWQELINKVGEKAKDIAERLSLIMLDIEKIITKLAQHQEYLKSNMIISHRDLDPKNVLWGSNMEHYIIDWETAGLINKAKDFVSTAVYWSLNPNYTINGEHLEAFSSQYFALTSNRFNPIEVEAGFYGLLGDWLDWLDFNINRILNNQSDSKEYQLGIEGSQLTIFALPILKNEISVGSVDLKIVIGIISTNYSNLSV